MQREGLRGFYRGVTPSLWGSGVSWGLYFYFLDVGKALMANTGDSCGSNSDLSWGKHMVAATSAGLVTAALTNPIWLIKTRMVIGNHHQQRLEYQYISLSHGIRSVIKHEGWMGLTRGMSAGLLGVSHGTVQIVCYDNLKKWRARMLNTKQNKHSSSAGEDVSWSGIDIFFIGAAAKTVAAVSTYPYQVVRSRMQQGRAEYLHLSFMGVCTRLWKQEGWRGFYRGLVLNVVKVTPAAAVTFWSYEFMLRELRLMSGSGTSVTSAALSDPVVLDEIEKLEEVE